MLISYTNNKRVLCVLRSPIPSETKVAVKSAQFLLLPDDDEGLLLLASDGSAAHFYIISHFSDDKEVQTFSFAASKDKKQKKTILCATVSEKFITMIRTWLPFSSVFCCFGCFFANSCKTRALY